MLIDRTKPEFLGDHCSPECPFLKPYEHPYYHHTAWCNRVEDDLIWWDYWIASCQQN